MAQHTAGRVKVIVILKNFLTSKDHRSYWIWVAKFLFGYPAGGFNYDPQHVDRSPKKKNTQRKALYSSEREGAIIGGTETKFKAEEERGGYQSPYESQQPPAA